MPVYFLNTVRSVRAVTPNDNVLVIDNRSPQAQLRRALRELADRDEHVELILRDSNDVRGNSKTGSLYAAYGDAMEYAIARHYDLLHILQNDMQMMWWDDAMVARSVELFRRYTNCLNIHTIMLPKDKQLGDELHEPDASGIRSLRKYGLTDTGLYHLGRWQEVGLGFSETEQAHAKRYLDAGYRVLCHPWPTDAQIPWPPVIRKGRQIGREVRTTRPFVLKPMSVADVDIIKSRSRLTWLEDVCIPWDWICLAPMWTTDLDSIDYWVLRYRDARANGVLRVLPRPVLRGIEGRGVPRLLHPFRPSLFRLAIAGPLHEIGRRLMRRIRS